MKSFNDDWTGEHRIRSVPKAAREIAEKEIERRVNGGSIATIETIMRLAAMGMSATRIAKELKCSIPYVSQIAHKYEIKVPDGRSQRRQS